MYAVYFEIFDRKHLSCISTYSYIRFFSFSTRALSVGFSSHVNVNLPPSCKMRHGPWHGRHKRRNSIFSVVNLTRGNCGNCNRNIGTEVLETPKLSPSRGGERLRFEEWLQKCHERNSKFQFASVREPSGACRSES